MYRENWQELLANRELTDLDLSYQSLNEEEDKLNVLKHSLENPALRSLNLAGNNISDTQLAVLLKRLADGSRLESLNLADNRLSADSIKLFRRARAYSLGKEERDKDKIEFPEFKLRSLDISGNPIGNEGLAHIGDMVQMQGMLQHIGMANTGITAQGVNECLFKLARSDVVSLTLAENALDGAQLDESFASNIRKIYTLKELNLSENMLGDAGAQKIASVIGAGLAAPSKLEDVGLDNNNIGDAGGEAIGQALAGNIYLKSLNLGHNWLGGKTFSKIGTAIKHNTSLLALDLSYNIPAPKDGNAQKEDSQGISDFFSGMLTNHGLREINLSGNHITGDMLPKSHSIDKKDKENVISLNLSDNPLEESGAMKIAPIIRNCINLAILNLGKCGLGDTDAGVTIEAARYSGIEEADLSYNNISSAGAAVIAVVLLDNSKGSHKGIVRLNLEGNQINDNGLKQMTNTVFHSKRLAVLDMGNQHSQNNSSNKTPAFSAQAIEEFSNTVVKGNSKNLVYVYPANESLRGMCERNRKEAKKLLVKAQSKDITNADTQAINDRITAIYAVGEEELDLRRQEITRILQHCSKDAPRKIMIPEYEKKLAEMPIPSGLLLHDRPGAAIGA